MGETRGSLTVLVSHVRAIQVCYVEYDREDKNEEESGTRYQGTYIPDTYASLVYFSVTRLPPLARNQMKKKEFRKRG